MSQKANPIGVRLGLNRQTESNWFSNYYYSALNAQDYVIRHYLNNIKSPKGSQLGIRTARSVIHHYPKQTQIHLFYLAKKPNILKIDSYERSLDYTEKSSQFNLGVTNSRQLVQFLISEDSTKKQAKLSKLLQNKQKLIVMKQQLFNSQLQNFNSSLITYSREFWKQKYMNWSNEKVANLNKSNELCFFSAVQNKLSIQAYKTKSDSRSSSFLDNTQLDSIQSLLVRQSQLFMQERFVLNHLDKRLSKYNLNSIKHESKKVVPNHKVEIISIKLKSLYQSANLLAEEICINLEKKKSFRQIWKSILFEANKQNYIKGIRITCSGRLNGAEIAKIECRKYGATSLHVFSDKIDYGFHEAKTIYGILGVKVWIAYKK